MDDHVKDKGNAVAPCGATVLVFRRVKRPIDEERPADEIFFGHKAPVAAVKAVLAVVAHGKIMPLGNHQVSLPVEVGRIFQRPRRGAALACGAEFRKVVTKRFNVVLCRIVVNKRLLLRHAVYKESALIKMDFVPWNTHNAFHQVQVMLGGRYEDSNFTPADLPVRHKWTQVLCRRRRAKPIYKNMVT